MNEKLTAVEWLSQNIPDLGKYIPFGVSMELHAKFQQAKEMEKQQITDAWNNSRKNKSDCSNWNCSGDEKTYDNLKQYYKETYDK
jgi:hypothetical protein